MVLFLGAIGAIVYKENVTKNNTSKPFPRPFALFPAVVGYTGLGFIAEWAPTIAMLVASGLTLSVLVKGKGDILNKASKSLAELVQKAEAIQ
ncbi:MAG: hypothetical protein ACREQ5_10185 [Candidatus Dormibacteria bacterium]